MGKKRVAVIGEAPRQTKQGKEKSTKEKKQVKIPGLKGGERIVVVTPELPEEPAEVKETPRPAKTAQKRGKKYLSARGKIDPTKSYSLDEAVKLVKETAISRFSGSVEVHVVAKRKGLRGEVALPYFTGKAKRIEIASEATLKKIESGKIDFDVLISSPSFMPNLVKYAKVLGPKGLMPNPKIGTIVDDPQKAVTQFQKAAFVFKTEADAPLIHTVTGKTSQKKEELEANLKALIKAIGPGNIKKAVICASMGPAIKLDLTSL